MTEAQAREFNIDVAHREIARRGAEGEDVSNLTVDPLTAEIVAVPTLDGDEAAFDRAHTDVAERMRAERRVIALLISHLNRAGFAITAASDGEEHHKCTTAKEAMEVIFSVDESHLYLRNPAHPNGHAIFFVLGNADDGSEVIADNSMGDGFDTRINEFFDALFPEYLVPIANSESSSHGLF